MKTSSSRVSSCNGLSVIITAIVAVILITTGSISAEMKNIYDNGNDDIAGINALMSAVANNDVNGARFFSKAGRALVNQKNFGGATALHLACRENNFEIAKILIEAGADTNVSDNEGWTPLMRASLAANKDIVDLLIKRDAQASSINSLGESAIIHATISNCSDCLNAMFEKFNFIQLMDTRLLKEQLTDAFIIARNHDNQVIQGLLESYLDRVIKTTPIIEKEKLALTEKPKEKTTEAIFRITSADENSEESQAKEPRSEANKASGNFSLKTGSNNPQRQQSYNQQNNANQETKRSFTFIVGAAGCDCSNKPSESDKIVFGKYEPTNIRSKPADKEVIFLVNKSSKSLITKSGDKLFKFNPGPRGKKRGKRIIKKTINHKPITEETKINATDTMIQSIPAQQPAEQEETLEQPLAQKSQPTPAKQQLQQQQSDKSISNNNGNDMKQPQSVTPKIIIGILPKPQTQTDTNQQDLKLNLNKSVVIGK